MDRIPAERAVAASVSRREIRDILQDTDAAPELVLEVVAGENIGEHGTISMTWSRDDLEKLLASASENEVVLTFDRDELAAALGDVEAHGMRARAAVFAVAAMGALGTGASIANAQIPGNIDGGPSGTPVAATTDGGALQARSEAMNVQYGLGDRASDATVTDASTGGGYAATPTASGGGGFEVQRPSTDEALLAGAALLTIAGAAFAARRAGTPRPA